MSLSATWKVQLPDGTEYTLFGEIRQGYMEEYHCVTVGIGSWADNSMLLIDPRAIISHILLGVIYTPRLYPLEQHQPEVAEWLRENPLWGVFEIQEEEKRA